MGSSGKWKVPDQARRIRGHLAFDEVRHRDAQLELHVAERSEVDVEEPRAGDVGEEPGLLQRPDVGGRAVRAAEEVVKVALRRRPVAAACEREQGREERGEGAAA